MRSAIHDLQLDDPSFAIRRSETLQLDDRHLTIRRCQTFRSTGVSSTVGLAEALEDSPAVLIQGPRQCGKTTLAQVVCAPRQLPQWGAEDSWAGSPVARGAEHAYFSVR